MSLITIENIDLTGYIDYDRNRLNQLTLSGKVDYFEFRANVILFRPLENILPLSRKNNLFKDGECNIMIAFTALICNGIEALGSFYWPDKDNNASGEGFKKFVCDYMHASYKKKNYWQPLRNNFRNGLAHGFAIKSGGVEGKKAPYFRQDPTLGLMINPWLLFEDFKKGFNKYINDVRDAPINSTIARNFTRRFEHIYILGK